ncbi:hypothetical protein M9458_037529, partial [Cirrhinus mrigala]
HMVRMPPCGGIVAMYNWKENPQQAQDALDGLHVSAGLETPWEQLECLGRPGNALLRYLESNWGFNALFKATSVMGIEGGRERRTFTPPTYNPCQY